MTDTDYKIGGEITVKLRIKSIGSEGGLIVQLEERQISLSKGDHIVGYEPPYIPDDLIAFDGTKWPECGPNDTVEIYHETGFQEMSVAHHLFDIFTCWTPETVKLGAPIGYRVVKKAESDND